MAGIDHEQMEVLAVLVAQKIKDTVQVAGNQPRWLNMKEAMAYAKTSERKLRAWVDEGYIYGFRRTGQYILDRESIDKWYNSERIDLRRF